MKQSIAGRVEYAPWAGKIHIVRYEMLNPHPAFQNLTPESAERPDAKT